MSSCLPISTISMSFVGFAVEVDHVAGLFGGLRAGVHRDADVGLRRARARRWSRRPSSPRALPPACSRSISAILSSGVASAMKSSTPASSAIAAAVQRVVAGDHDRADAHRAHLVEPLVMPCFTMSLRWITPSTTLPFGDDERRAAVVRDAVDDRLERRRGCRRPVRRPNGARQSAAPLRIERPVEVRRRSCGSAR